MEWLMEELEAPPASTSSSSHRGRSNHGNGHIRTGLRSFSLDEQDDDDDSEEEVLSVPGVRVLKSSGMSRHSAAHRGPFLQVCTVPTSVQAFVCFSAAPNLTDVLRFRRRATRTWWASWTSRTGRGRAANLAPQGLITTRRPTGSGTRTTATRTSSGCDVTYHNQAELLFLSECLHNSSNRYQQHIGSRNLPSLLELFFYCFLIFFLGLQLYFRLAPVLHLQNASVGTWFLIYWLLII